MPLFGKPRRVEFVTAPAESPVDELVAEAQVVEVDDKLTRLSVRPHREPGVCDRLLDLRNAIRPARDRDTPYVPGRS
jgi:hypothetical protein